MGGGPNKSLQRDLEFVIEIKLVVYNLVIACWMGNNSHQNIVPFIFKVTTLMMTTARQMMTIKAPRPAAMIIVEPSERGHVFLLQGLPRIFSVSATVQETVASFGLHARVCIVTPRVPHLWLHSGPVQLPSMNRSGGMEI